MHPSMINALRNLERKINVFNLIKDTYEIYGKPVIIVVQSLSCVWLFVTPWSAASQASLSFTISWSCSNSCPLSQWCRPTISSSVVPFSSCLPSFTASESFLMSQFFASGGQSIGASVSASVLPVNIQCWFPLGIFTQVSAEYIMRNAGLEEAQPGIKISRRNINISDMQMIPPLWQKVKEN